MIYNAVSYRFRIPDDVGQLFGYCGDEVKHQDNQDDEGTQEPPSHLPEDVGLVTDHELDIVIKPVQMEENERVCECVYSSNNVWVLSPEQKIFEYWPR